MAECELIIVAPPRSDRAHIVLRVYRAVDRAWEWLFGGVSLVVALAMLAALPLVQLLSLGYLLEASGRIARTGRFRSGFVGVRKAARIGSLVAGGWVLFWLPRLAASLWHSAELIDPDSRQARIWHVVVVLVTAAVVVHVAAAWVRGGRLRHFLWPRPVRFLRWAFRPGSYAAARDAVWDFVTGLRLPYYFWLGLRGFVGGMIWLVVPITLLALGRRAPLLGVLGGLQLAAVMLYLPFLQTHFARDGRFRAMFDLRAVRQAQARAPLAYLLALSVTLAAALPLYLLKIELIPREAAWLPSLLFVMSIFPARLLCGWAAARAQRRTEPRHLVLRVAGWSAMAPIAVVYVAIVYATQYLSWYGVWSLYEQHAVLVPVPFLGG